MKIEELIKKTGDKLISQKDKLAYYMAVKKLELIAKIPNKEQRSEAMGKFKDVLAKKVTPVVMAALTAISPVVLAGCDETKNPNETQIAYVTDTNGEYVTDSNGNPETTIITTPAGTIPDFEFGGLTEKMKENLQAYFADFDFSKVLNGDYSKSVDEYFELMHRGEINKNQSYMEGVSTAPETYYMVYDYFFKNVTGGDDKIAFNIDFTGADATITFYREGVETAGFILKYPNGQTVYNGVFNNEVYTDGQEYLKNIPIAINEERKVALEQLNSSELGKIYGDGIISYFIDSDIWRGQGGLKVLSFIQPHNSKVEKEKGFDHRVIKMTELRYLDDSTIIPAYLNLNFKRDKEYAEDYSSYVNHWRVEKIYFEVGECTFREEELISIYQYRVLIKDPVRLASIQLDLEPQNIKLPTQESEAEK